MYYNYIQAEELSVLQKNIYPAISESFNSPYRFFEASKYITFQDCGGHVFHPSGTITIFSTAP